MKKLAFYSTAFLMAAVFGLGIAVSLAPTASAGICYTQYPQYVCIEDHPLCAAEPIRKAAGFICGSWNGQGGDPCLCEFTGCYKGCPEPL